VVDREWLREQLAAGRSIEAIAREVGRHPSSVAYWVNKHGLASMHAVKHSAKGPVERVVLEQLVEERLTIEQIGRRLGIGSAAVRHWLRKYGLRTARARRGSSETPVDREVIRECQRHGWTVFVVSGTDKRLRCKRCRSDHVSARRRRVKAILVAEAGGCCQLCGYDRYAGALQFHHRDPTEKAFGLATQGVARSLSRARAEVIKCILLCANCHAEVEGGLANIPPRRAGSLL
jgi:transposase-like protein